jgi:vacuolar protein sorting-associated protein 52
MLVLLDNASAEFAFLVRFFGTSSASALPSRPTSPGFSSSPRLPWGIQAGSQSRLESDSGSMASFAAAEEGVTARSRLGGGSRSGPGPGLDKSEASELEGLWHQVFDPAITYCQVRCWRGCCRNSCEKAERGTDLSLPLLQSLITTLLTPPPSLPCHLAMIRLNDAVLAELESRGCTPLEAFVISQRLSLWPSFQKQMGLNLESLKKLADLAGAGSGLLGLAKSGGGVKDNLVAHVHLNRFLLRLRGSASFLTDSASSLSFSPFFSLSFCRL